MLAVIVFIIILGVLIFVHELGHFVTARRNGITASEFGFGFPPRIFGVQKVKGDKNGSSFEKWRFIWGRDGDDEEEKKDLDEAKKNGYSRGTIYSLNWLPLGGFVKIKGEDGENKNEEDSFSHKSAWTRIKVLAAGVAMNFVLAWVLISLVFMIGAPESIDPAKTDVSNSKIQISSILEDTPASAAGVRVGDEVLKTQKDSSGKAVSIGSIAEFQDFIASQKGKNLELSIKRGQDTMQVLVTPRANYPENQGPLGVSLTQTAVVRYPWYQSIFKGAQYTWELTSAIVLGLGGIVKSLFSGQGAGADVAGPIGIAILTRDVTNLGLVYIFQFAAILSINLGIINILPIPALDGGRILFVLVEKIKGSPVSQKLEQLFHTVGFVVLIMLMLLVTFGDVLKLIK